MNIPAFPRPISVSPTGLESNQQVAFDQQGMTLLDYFACHFADSVMKKYPLLYRICEISDEKNEESLNARRRFIALESYALAKAFLNVRENDDNKK